MQMENEKITRCVCGDFRPAQQATCGRAVCVLGQEVGKAIMAVVCERCGFARCVCAKPEELYSETVFVACDHDGASYCRCAYCENLRAARAKDVHSFNRLTATRLVRLLASVGPVQVRELIACAALDQAELRGHHDGTAGVCPGFGVCFARNGSHVCRVHGCRVCGSPAIAGDCSDWPAPLCLEHAPSSVIGYWKAAFGVLEHMLEAFDGVHNPDCVVLALAKGPVRDLELGQTPCSCGALALRNQAREKLGRRVLESVLALAEKGQAS
jgi:hypothetical protein